MDTSNTITASSARLDRRDLMKLTGAGVAALAAASLFNLSKAKAQGMTADWDKTFPKSEKVDHRKVTFKNRYGITLAGDLYLPKRQGDLSRRTAPVTIMRILSPRGIQSVTGADRRLFNRRHVGEDERMPNRPKSEVNEKRGIVLPRL
ncbi:twin-arginine translocation signal domain-containing protein [Bosea sp. 2YAB26]|uniref:twin-arginine translocation signal domain-containing protein n=1 Tax=Bosea sp. 2YAB26 TaxID=3237478 RepID=UPI003F91ABA9